MDRRLEAIFRDLPAGDISAVVLGCTHFIYIKPRLKALLGENVRYYDGNAGTAQQALRMLRRQGLMTDTDPSTFDPESQITIDTSGEKGHVIPLCRRLIRTLMKDIPFSSSISPEKGPRE